MKQRTEDAITAFLAGLALFALIFVATQQAHATNNGLERLAQAQEQGQAQQQEQTATSAATANSNSVSASTANNDGNSLNVGGDSVENNSSNVVLVPNNNTESCVRVWGIAFGRDSDSAALGIPWRSKACDYEQAADDAFAAGERDLGWFWKCQNKNLYKRFQAKGESVDSAIGSCHSRMLADTRDEVVTQLEEQLRLANQRAEAAEQITYSERRQHNVCKDSLDRCEEQAYGDK